MNQYALLVGIGTFQHGLQSLSYVEDDVNAFCNILVDCFGIDSDNIEYLTNSLATQDAIMSAVETLCQKADKGDRVILYFATHGKTTYNTTYLSAYDALANNDNDTDGWIRVEKILGDFHNIGCSILAFLDSCHSTQFCISRAADNLSDFVVSTNDSSGEYMAVFAAAGENEKAYPDPAFGHGCWTYYLLEALSGRAPRAFNGNSGRITIHSLQPYLKEKVSARMREAYQKTQTPHIWGTYSDDVVIIEYNPSEVYNMKIKDIYFGAIDADSERDRAPHADYIAKNFYDLNSICEQLVSNSGIQLIIGNKGSGKTYLGEYLDNTDANTIYQTVSAITLADIQRLTTAQADARGKYVPAWLYTLYTLLSCIIITQEKPGADEFKALLSEIYPGQLDIILEAFEAGKTMLWNKRIKRGVKLSAPFDSLADENGSTYIDGLITLYTYLFNKYYKANTLYFLLDGLDEHLSGKMNDDQQKYLLDLLAAVDRSHKSLTGVKIILLFRNDLLHALPGEANKNKTITARSCNLDWLSIDTDYCRTPLYQFLERRIFTSAESMGITENISLANILPAQMQSAGDYQPVNTWNWILSLTTYTPRDIVSFFNCCQKYAGEQHCFNQDNLWDATRDYSLYLWDEFQDVLVGSCLADLGPQLESLFNRIAQTHNRKSNTRFSFSEFQGIYLETDKLKDIPIADALKVLYEAGMMCVHTNSGTYWNFRENPLKFDYNIWKEAQFDIHTGLWKKLHIW